MVDGYRFGGFELLRRERRLQQDGEAVPLGARAFDLLLALVEGADRLLTKQELIDAVWPGVVVEENNLTVQASALRRLLGPDAVATVTGRGYRFTLTVESISSTVEGRGDAANRTNAHEAHDAPLPPKLPSIVVLPFTNLAGDGGDAWFCDGMTDDLLTELSRFHSLFVIARATAFTYKDVAADVRAVGRELGVRYVLQRSIR